MQLFGVLVCAAALGIALSAAVCATVCGAGYDAECGCVCNAVCATVCGTGHGAECGWECNVVYSRCFASEQRKGSFLLHLHSCGTFIPVASN